MAKDLDTKEGSHIVKKHMKRCSILLVLREMQIKAIMRHHFAPMRIGEIYEIDNGCWQMLVDGVHTFLSQSLV